MADNILFKSGLASKLNDITKTAGQLLFAIDGTSGSIYLDKDSTTRIKMNLDATKLQDARTINGTAFDGTQNITTANWGSKRTITISDNSGTNTQSNANIDGSSNFTLKLPATITATLKGNADTATHATSADSATTATTTTGNAGTATKLKTARNINGTAFDGSANITTANWGTARNIYIASSDGTGAGEAVSVNGEANTTLKLPTVIKATVSAADKLTVNAGDSNTPVYFENGIPKAVTSIDVKSDKAGILDPGAKINGTTFTGATDITTTNWGTSRTISISDTAGTTGTSVNGSTNYSLIVPSTMTGFNSITSNKLITTTVSSDTGHIVFPDGGQYITSTSSKTGYLKITLPVSWTNAMMRFYVDIYNYSSDSSFTYIIGGYNYSGNNSYWTNTSAQSIGPAGKGLGNLTVRFGHDGSKCAIYIGEANTSWSYPQIMIRDVLIGFGQDEKNYTTGWNIDFTTTLGTITSTISNPNVAYKLYASRTINGTAFDGSGNITTANWGTARDLTIGNSTKSVNGSAAMAWTLSDIGAVAKAGDTMTGILTGKTTNDSWIGATRSGAFRTSTAASEYGAASIFSMKTKNGSWGIANLYNSDNLYFIFGTDVDYNASTNNTKNYYIDTLGNFSGSAAKWTNPRNIKINSAAGTPVETANLDGTQNVSLNIPTTITNFTKVESDTFVVNDKVTLQYNSTNECLEFVFA